MNRRERADRTLMLEEPDRVPLFELGINPPITERIIDLSFNLTDGMPVYPTDPTVKITRFATIDTLGVNLSRIEMGSHSGTHIDAPLHFLPQGKPVDQLAYPNALVKLYF